LSIKSHVHVEVRAMSDKPVDIILNRMKEHHNMSNQSNWNSHDSMQLPFYLPHDNSCNVSIITHLIEALWIHN